jgi:hypothetical protein
MFLSQLPDKVNLNFGMSPQHDAAAHSAFRPTGGAARLAISHSNLLCGEHPPSELNHSSLFPSLTGSDLAEIVAGYSGFGQALIAYTSTASHKDRVAAARAPLTLRRVENARHALLRGMTKLEVMVIVQFRNLQYPSL